MTILAITCQDGISTFQMLDDARRNTLGTEMLNRLIAAFDDLPSDTRVVILRAGPEASVWCSGFDIRALDIGRDPLAPDELLPALFGRIASCPAPVIGMVHGSTWGGGTDLALRCDILVGDTTCRFAFTPARLGLPYDRSGLLNVLLRGGPALALEMFATAAPIEADRALRTGLLSHLVAPENLERFTVDLAHRIARNAPLTITSAKKHLRALTDALELTDTVRQSLDASRAHALSSSDYAEGLAAFRDKRSPVFTGS